LRNWVNGSKRYFIVAALLAVVCALFSCSPASTKIKLVCFGSDCFQLEVASTKEARLQGLMHRKVLAADHGMLFVFEESAIYPFWMKDTFIPLDIVWLSDNWQIVFVKTNARPLDASFLTPTRPARYVMEFNAGTVERLGLRIGEFVTVK